MQFGVQFFPDVRPEEKSAVPYFAEALDLADQADRLGFTHIRIVGLVLLWLAARIGMAGPAFFPAPLAAAVELAFVPALALLIAGPLFAAGQKRNLMLLLPLAAFWLGDALMQAEFLGLAEDVAMTGAHLGIDVLLLMIAVIGGRIVPTFTTNALRAAGQPVAARSNPFIDRAAVAAMALLVVGDAVLGDDSVTGAVALAAAALNAVRLAGWRGARALGSPVLWVLHLGYVWLVLGLALKGAAAFTDAIPDTAALHALTAGAIATMLLAVMSRAALGHTARALRAHPAIIAAYLLVPAAALRIAAALLPELFAPLLIAAGAAWTMGFVLFVVVYAPILLRPRADRRPG